MRYLLIIFLLCTGCVTVDAKKVPISDVSMIEHVPKNGQHRVMAHETLYSIAWRYGLDYRYLARLNHIPPTYAIRVGETIQLTPKKFNHAHPLKPKKNQVTLKPTQQYYLEREPSAKINFWQWPASGPVIGQFSTLNKGINIAGHLGDSVFAAAPGKVVYSGEGLRTYGNLIIIKHNSTFLTAYAHNNKVFVHEGEWIKRGQKIAEMGNTGTQTVMLHFEIRRNGQPINPLIYLTKKI